MEQRTYAEILGGVWIINWMTEEKNRFYLNGGWIMKKKGIIQSFKSSKIFVSNPETSVRVQIKLFEFGYGWNGDGQEIRNTNYPFLFIDDIGVIRCSYDYNRFIAYKKKELTISEVLNANKEKGTEFKVLDYVLVRNYGGIWHLAQYAFITTTPSRKYVTVGGFYWDECIFYEGNENLLSTRKNF